MAISQEELGRRIRLAREANNWSQGRLAEAVGLTQSAISRVESGGRALDSIELAEMAEVLRVSPLQLLEDNPLRVRLAARAVEDHDGSAEEALARAEELLEIRRLLGSLGYDGDMQERRALRLDLDEKDTDIDQGRKLAEQVRRHLRLGSRPVGDLAQLVESKLGLDLAIEQLPEGIAGLYVEHDQVALALVDSSAVPGRRRFTIAHELCHHLCKDAADHTDAIVDLYRQSQKKSERRANSFAAHLLMPIAGLEEQINNREIDGQVVVELEYEFGVSHDALLWHLVNNRLTTKRKGDCLAATGPKTLAYLHGFAGEWEGSQRQIGLTRSPTRLYRKAMAAYRDGLVGIEMVASLLGGRDPESLRRELADMGVGPGSEWIDDTAPA